MPTLLVHLLLSAAVQAFVNVSVNLPGINEFSFYAAITAVLVDLDHRSDGERSPYVHSLATVTAVLVIGIAANILLQDARPRLLVSSIIVGLVSHVLVDATDGRGIFIVPWNCDQRISLKRLAKGCAPMRGRLHLVIAATSAIVLLIFLFL